MKNKQQRRQRFQCQHWSFIWLIHDSHSRRRRRKRRMAAEKGLYDPTICQRYLCKRI